MATKEVTISYKCKYCGTKHNSISKAEKCEEKCRERSNIQKNFKRIVNRVRLQAESIADIERLTNEATKKLKRRIKVKFESLSYSRYVSNTHSCPIGGVRNFSRKDGKPTGYPGFNGRICIEKFYFRQSEYRDVWEEIPGINIICGGGNGKRYKYDVNLFLSDFPKIEAKMAELEKLEDKKTEFENKEYDKREKLSKKVEEAVSKDKEFGELLELESELKKQLEEATAQKIARSEKVRVSVEKRNKVLKPTKTDIDKQIEKLEKEIGL